MPYHATKVNEYVANRQVLIRTIPRGDPLVVIRADNQDLLSIDLKQLVEAAVEIGAIEAVVREVEPDCVEEIAEAIRDHMADQPESIVCSSCGEDLNYDAVLHYRGSLDIKVDPCSCVKED